MNQALQIEIEFQCAGLLKMIVCQVLNDLTVKLHSCFFNLPVGIHDQLYTPKILWVYLYQNDLTLQRLLKVLMNNVLLQLVRGRSIE